MTCQTNYQGDWPDEIRFGETSTILFLHPRWWQRWTILGTGRTWSVEHCKSCNVVLVRTCIRCKVNFWIAVCATYLCSTCATTTPASNISRYFFLPRTGSRRDQLGQLLHIWEWWHQRPLGSDCLLLSQGQDRARRHGRRIGGGFTVQAAAPQTRQVLAGIS